MMTLRRFRALAESYGANLQRWPERLRPQARRLLESSAAAQEIMARAAELDEAIRVAAIARSESVWSSDRAEAAVVRLRNGVATRITAATNTVKEVPPRAALSRAGRARWIGLATVASVAMLAGVVLGILYSPTTSHQDLLAVLQPGPIQLLND